MFIKNKNIKRYLLVFLFIVSVFFVGYSVNAQIDFGTNVVAENIGLSSDSPIQIATRLINIVMIILGVLAIGLIIYGGFIWMTSGGSEDKIDQAKKILKNGVIGLVIILSAWGITIFILNKLISATGNGNDGQLGCTTGQILACGCDGTGTRTCNDSGSWGPCLGEDCSGNGNGLVYCDASPNPGCQADNNICADDRYCESSSCTCVPAGSLGDSCNANAESQTCEANDDLCGEYLTCNAESCTCEGSPVITSISPIGGFCENNINQSCLSDADCAGTCNITDPNGAINNLITINGANFGNYDTASSRVLFTPDVVGTDASNLNPNCIDTWTNKQIIVAVPASAQSGAIIVETASGQSDSTDNNVGPLLPDFLINSIVRPGLCLMSPDTGELSAQVNYQGFNLRGAEAYFGNYQANVRGLNSVFSNPTGLDGFANVPNVKSGKMSSFVVANIGGNQENSNYVNFYKEEDPNSGPFISYFEPVSGRAGQYLTIYGSGFANVQGFSKVFFGDIEANYEFPPACANSTWNNGQIVVKVPSGLTNGSYPISIEINNQLITSQNANPNIFQVNSDEPLRTSICRISPSRGQVGTIVNIWGEYFGGVNSSAMAVFTSNKSVSQVISSDQGAEKIAPPAPLGASSGPLRVLKNGEWGNTVNFEIGSCNSNSECGNDVCCPSGTYRQNECVNSVTECYIGIPNSIFEWSFSTAYSGTGTGTSTPYDSCQGMANSLGACQVGAFCPNSAGLCSPYQGVAKSLGACDSSCNSLPACQGGACTYDSNRDVCVLSAGTCSLKTNLEYQLNGAPFNATQTCKVYPEYNNQAHWEIKVPTSCPNNWTKLSGNRCVDSVSSTSSTCSVCDNAFTCVDYGGNEGACVTASLCPQGASCSGNTCVTTESSRCDCCCEIGQDARDCCAPLVCAGTCGSDTSDDNSGFGSCSGCAIPASGGGFDQGASDNACNCAINSGKYCDVSVPTGVCNDCSRLSRDACLEHSQTCCLDSRGTANINDDVCVGGSGQEISSDPTSSDYGYCAYYNCENESGNPSLCDLDNPQKIGLFRDQEYCSKGCGQDPGMNFCSQHNGDYTSCSLASGCCYNYSDGSCQGGESIDPLNGHCARYSCQNSPNEGLCDLTPRQIGAYGSITACEASCEAPPTGAGKDCRNIFADNSCNTGLCGSPFACLTEAGSSGLPGDCGTCCCQVSNPESCSGIGNGSLVCQPNQTPCGGENRGLCCGCSQDSDCGDGAVNVGCDSGTCCRARPQIIADEISPAHGANEICRNAGITIPFDSNMSASSLKNNIMLFEERDYANGPCPSGTFIAQSNENNKSLAGRINLALRQSFHFIRSIFTSRTFSNSALAHSLPAGNKLYCSVPGSVSVNQTGVGSVAQFKPKKLLSPGAKYYLVVKGDENLDSSSGVISSWQIGMNGQGFLDSTTGQYVEGANINFNNLSFHNSHITSFATLSDQGTNAGVCAVDYIKTSPSSYLFQTTENSLEENDTDINHASFDTISDRDKLFNANAYSATNQLLIPTAGYYWDWNFSVMNNNIATIIEVEGQADNQSLVSAASGVTDANTIMKSSISMDRFLGSSCDSSSACVCSEPGCLNNCCNAYDDGNQLEVNTPLFVFLCKNPWPAIQPGTLNWSPWYDTCEGASGNCANYNYQFYYCRDYGSEGLEDDLPAMINPGLIIGNSSSLVCSEGRTPCSGLNSRCGSDNNGDGVADGFCVWGILKESYFFKEAKPSIGAITAAIDRSDGNSVEIQWYGDSSLIYNTNAARMGKYRLYYAPENSGTWSFLDLKPNALDPARLNSSVCSPTVPNSGQNYNCAKVIKGLNNNTTYRFKVSALSINQVESALSDEKTVLVTDNIAPNVPSGLSYLVVNGDRLRFTWTANTDDTLLYRLYHGINSGLFAQSFDSDHNATSMELDLRQFPAGVNYFTLSAIDVAGNESNKGLEITTNLNGQ